MPWPIPPVKTVFERVASAIEAGILSVRTTIDPIALSRSVRSKKGLISQIMRPVATEIREVHDHISYWAREWFPDTSRDYAERHASIWGITRRPATPAVGVLRIEGTAGTVLAAGAEFSASNGVRYTLDAAATIPVGGAVDAVVTASAAGLGGNLEAGIRLSAFVPNPSIARVTVQAPGLVGGAEEETDEELSAATLAHIRQRPHGGAGFDYPMWLRSQFPVRAVRTVPDWIGRGSVGVIVAMKDGTGTRVPSQTELDNMLAFLGRPSTNEGVRPVTAHVVMVPATLRTLTTEIRLRPDTTAVRASATEAWQRFVVTLGGEQDPINTSPIGATIERSRLVAAISAAAGEDAHDLIAPAATLTLGATEYPIAGAITWAAAP